MHSHLPHVADEHSEHQGDGEKLTRVVLACLCWWLCGVSILPVPSQLEVLCDLVVEVDQQTKGNQEKRFMMTNFQFGAPAMVVMSIQ